MIATAISRLALVATLAAAAGTATAQTAGNNTSPPGDASDASTGAPGNEIIVTGTRTTGIRAADSAAPIQVLGSDALKRVGQPDLNSALAQQLPSIQIQSGGADQAIFHPAVKLRGLSPNHTLVEINGKRRHGTSNVVVSGGAFGGGAAPDLSLIPEDAIDHIEVLQDGAAAQYGTDAIAGVVNFILKKNPGVTFDGTSGHYMDEGGFRYDMMGRIGFNPVENGYISLTAERSFRDYDFRGDVDPRVANTSNATVAARLAAYPSITRFPGYPYVNRIAGDARQVLTNGLYNAGYDITPDVQVYSFGTYSHRTGRAFENYRLPTVVVGKSPTDIPFPAGFNPQELTIETDYAATGGIKGEVMDTTFDLSTTYGKDINKSYVDHSSNAALYYDTSNFTTVNGITTYVPGQSPSKFYDGSFTTIQWSNTLDLTHKFDLGLANPLNVAGGIEYRRETYQLKAGDPASYYVSPYSSGAKGGGAQSFFGYSPANASNNHRNNFSEYLDVNLKPIDAATIDAAVRHEHYSDFGSTTVFKLTGRFDFSPAFAIRGTASTGFRAPTLAEEFYSGINVGPTNISGVLAPNSSGAAFLGISGLKPEKSTNFSAGIVAHPAPKLQLTVDAYYIKIRNRIVQSGTFYGADYLLGVPTSTIVSPSVLTALRANGVPVDAVIASIIGPPVQTGNVSAVAFVNGVSTRTEGVDLTANYSSDFGGLGRVEWSLTGNYNKTKITKLNAPPSNVNQGVILLDPNTQTLLTNSTPKFRVTANAYWTWNKLSVNLRESYYSKTTTINQDTNGAYTVPYVITNKFITDLEVGYQVTKFLKVSAGANNLFNKYPNQIPGDFRLRQYNGLSNGYVTKYPGFSPIGVNGGYYYGRVSINF